MSKGGNGRPVMTTILGIETSCDETAAAVVRDGRVIVSSVVASQIARHAVYGGVVPELAAREHLKAIGTVVDTALSEAEVGLDDLDGIAVTNGPGLLPALLVGVNYARGLSASSGLPLFGVNHFFAHIYGAFLDSNPEVLRRAGEYPILALVVSGGHTALLLIDASGAAKVIGTTLDDAVGEAFDKAAKLLNLGYPGGPVIERLARDGDAARFAFPRPLTGAAGKKLAAADKYNFSFSGVKTALLYHCRKHGGGEVMEGELLNDTIASYQEALIDTLGRKTFSAINDFGVKTAVVCGGVACNGALRERMTTMIPDGVELCLAPRKYCTDNAAMVAGLGCVQALANPNGDGLSIDAYARLPVISTVPFGI